MIFETKELVEIQTWASPVGFTGCAVRLLGQMERSAL